MEQDAMLVRASRLDRRRLLAGAAAAGLVSTLGVTLAYAQEATPAPGTESGSATPEAGSTAEAETTTGAEEAAALLARVDEAIASAQADRTAAGDAIDVTVVDSLLGQASALRERVAAAATTPEAISIRRLARAAIAAADAAGDLIRAQLTDYGLPSQQERAARVLAAAYERIQALSTEGDVTADAEAATFIATAQALYQTAYELFNAGAYARAAGTARVAAKTGQIAALLTANEADAPDGVGGFGGDDDRPGRSGGRAGRGRSRDDRPGSSRDDDDDAAEDDAGDSGDVDDEAAPAPPPEPVF